MKKSVLLISMILVPLGIYSQKLTSSYGKASIEDLQMTEFDADTTAPAIVLYQSGYFNSNTLEFTFFRRIKVLKKEGTSLAEFTFNADESSSVRGRTLNLVNGKIVEDKIGKGNIFKQMITQGSWYYRIAMPNVREGSVIEIEYRMFFLPPSYKFQDIIPVVRAELLLEENPQIEFRKTQVGYTTVRSTKEFYYADYVPAFKTESFTNSPNNYITRFDFDILRITIPGLTQTFTTDWASVNKLLMDDTYFGKALEVNPSYLSTKKDEIDARTLTGYEKMVAAYESMKSVKWNNEERLYTSSTGLRSRFAEGSANSAEINMMLCHLLRRLGIASSMVVISTRDNGLLNPVYPSLQKLNYAIVLAVVDGKEYVMDATERYMPFGMLPLRALNQQGRLVEEGEGKWVSLTPDKPEKTVITCDLEIDESDRLKGRLKEEMEDYAAFYFRKAYHNFNSEDEFVESVEKESQGMSIMSFRVNNLDDIYKKCEFEADFIIGGKVQRAGDMLIINPFVSGQITDNPFKTEKRIYPVDFAYRRLKEYSTVIKLPEGYVIERIPGNGQYKTKDGGITVTINYSVDDKAVTVNCIFAVNKIQFLPDEYGLLRDVYNQVIAKQAEPVILKKSSDGH